jgi:copper chaperone CopZ
VQSALEAVKGVKEAKVSLENHEAVVKFDPEQVKVEDLIKAVKEARGMNDYEGKVTSADCGRLFITFITCFRSLTAETTSCFLRQ